MSWKIGGLILALVTAATATAPTTAVARRPSDNRVLTFYSLSAHPDDEGAGWALLEKRPDTYIVFVVLSAGEQTTSCMSPHESRPPSGPGLDDATMVEGFAPTDPFGLEEHPDGDRYHGPYKYQGPGSPVGQPDKGERHPLGNPWVGQGSEDCKDARVASWHWYLDDMADLDPSLPDMHIDVPETDDDYKGEFCNGPGGCAKVWANDDGARVAFDLADGHITAEAVVAAFQRLRTSRVDWGIRDLPEGGAYANAYHAGSDAPLCSQYDHPDHEAVQDALYLTDQQAGPQFGVSCAAHPRFIESPAAVAPQDAALMVAQNYVDPVTEQRVGAWTVNYGWLFETYRFTGCPDCPFWERFGPDEHEERGRPSPHSRRRQ